jgi:hypothetical protein
LNGDARRALVEHFTSEIEINLRARQQAYVTREPTDVAIAVLLEAVWLYRLRKRQSTATREDAEAILAAARAVDLLVRAPRDLDERYAVGSPLPARSTVTRDQWSAALRGVGADTLTDSARERVKESARDVEPSRSIRLDIAASALIDAFMRQGMATHEDLNGPPFAALRSAIEKLCDGSPTRDALLREALVALGCDRKKASNMLRALDHPTRPEAARKREGQRAARS